VFVIYSVPPDVSKKSNQQHVSREKYISIPGTFILLLHLEVRPLWMHLAQDIGPVVGSCEHCNESSGSMKGGISWLAERLSIAPRS